LGKGVYLHLLARGSAEFRMNMEISNEPHSTPKISNVKVQISNQIQSSNIKDFGFCNLTFI